MQRTREASILLPRMNGHGQDAFVFRKTFAKTLVTEFGHLESCQMFVVTPAGERLEHYKFTVSVPVDDTRKRGHHPAGDGRLQALAAKACVAMALDRVLVRYSDGETQFITREMAEALTS